MKLNLGLPSIQGKRMEQKKAIIDSVSVSRATDTAIQYGESIVQRALEFMRDDKRKQRLAEAECKTCFYVNNQRIGGSAMTSRPCGICEIPQMYGSTATDKLCVACAVKHQLCKQCGGDLLLRPRRIFKTDSTVGHV